MDLTDEQWAIVEPLIIRPPRRTDGKGQPRQDDRPLLNGMFCILRTGAPWPDLPERYPPFQSVHRRLQEWVANGTFERILTVLADDLLKRGQLDLRECFIDGTTPNGHPVAKKGAPAWERPSAGTLWVDTAGEPSLGAVLTPNVVLGVQSVTGVWAQMAFPDTTLPQGLH